jgi:hypothetical protein
VFCFDTGFLFAGLFARFFVVVGGECVATTPTVLVCFFVVVVARTPSAPPLSFSPSPSPGVVVSAGVFFLFFPIVVAFAVRVVLSSVSQSVDHDDRTIERPNDRTTERSNDRTTERSNDRDLAGSREVLLAHAPLGRH